MQGKSLENLDLPLLSMQVAISAGRVTRVSFAKPAFGLPKVSGMLLGMANWKPDQVRRLADAVVAQRTHLGLSQMQVWQAGGPSNSTLTDIEKGRATSLEYGTLRKLDVALQWERGTALSYLSGKPLTRPSTPSISQANDSPTADQITQALAVLVSAGLAELQRRAQGWPQGFLSPGSLPEEHSS
jgi:hypothetical protein